MAIRLRRIRGQTVALCAAKTNAQEGDVYLGDNEHHALMVKFTVDLESEGWMKENPPVDEMVKQVMLEEEEKVEIPNDLTIRATRRVLVL